MSSRYQPCSLDLVLDTFNAQLSDSRVLRYASYLLKTPHTSFLPSSFQPSSTIHSPCLTTIYQHSLNTGIIYFSLQYTREDTLLYTRDTLLYTRHALVYCVNSIDNVLSCYSVVRLLVSDIHKSYCDCNFNPLRLVAISKLLELIGRSAYILACSPATAPDSDINQTAGSGGHLSMWENRCMYAKVCLLHAGQPRRAGNAAKSGQFIGQFSWVTSGPIGVKGLFYIPESHFGFFFNWNEYRAKQKQKMNEKLKLKNIFKISTFALGHQMRYYSNFTSK